MSHNPFKSQGGFRRILQAAGYSAKGFKAAYQHEAAFRQELLLAIVLVPLAFFIAQTLLELVMLIGSIVFILTTELLNSAIETVADAVTSDYHPLIGRAKDIASAAVVLSFFLAAMIWLAVAYTRFAPSFST
ncbi:diacylglycerol kinase [Paenalcaligenes niemegkensis]|uniref:diacylglycerol kinase n=1 Tax=Paenalcaligenes niemegkensis TaxID=2895469 RepID=UPI002151B92F